MFVGIILRRLGYDVTSLLKAWRCHQTLSDATLYELLTVCHVGVKHNTTQHWRRLMSVNTNTCYYDGEMLRWH